MLNFRCTDINRVNFYLLNNPKMLKDNMYYK